MAGCREPRYCAAENAGNSARKVASDTPNVAGRSGPDKITVTR
jgi:hypothetical protein